MPHQRFHSLPARLLLISIAFSLCAPPASADPTREPDPASERTAPAPASTFAAIEEADEETLTARNSPAESSSRENSPRENSLGDDREDGPPETFEGEVTVTASEPGYLAAESTSAGKMAIPLFETPQSVTVLERSRLDDLESTGLQEALEYAAGVRSDAYGLDSRADSFLVRGATPDKYLDGLRQHFDFYTSTTRTDPYLLERIEVLRGPASTLYGQGTTAGLVNMVSKRPEAVPSHRVDLQLGSYERQQARADLTGPLGSSDNWLYRLVSVVRRSETQVDHVDDDRMLLAPSLTWQPNAATSMTFQMLWQQDRSGSTTQFLPWQGTVLPNPNGPIPVETFIGDPDNDHYDSERLSFGWLLEHRPNDRWTLRQNFRWADNQVDYRSIYSDSFIRPGNSFLDPDQRILGRFAHVSETDVRMWTVDQHAETTFETGPLRHHFLVGVDATRSRQNGGSVTDFPDYIGGGVPSIDVFDPVSAPYTPPAIVPSPQSTQEQIGVYVQDQLELGDHWTVLTGLRWDRADNSLEGEDDEETTATTGRVGLLYAADNGLAPYISYSESFTPLGGTDLNNRRFDPLRGEQIELGVRYMPRGLDFAVSAAIYELKEENRLVMDPTNPLNQIQAGETESSGFEIEATGRLGSRLEVSSHYNYLDNDEELDQLPEHQATIWARRDFAWSSGEKLSVALGARYFSSFAYEGAPEVPELTLFDARLAWQTDRWSLALNVHNLEDEVYVSTCLPRGDCFYGSRRSALVTAGTRF